jgi:hypothetical protein
VLDVLDWTVDVTPPEVSRIKWYHVEPEELTLNIKLSPWHIVLEVVFNVIELLNGITFVV